jgi:acyl-CoA reductase-like NAD-dependent aldehyde dehydrogenase
MTFIDLLPPFAQDYIKGASMTTLLVTVVIPIAYTFYKLLLENNNSEKPIMFSLPPPEQSLPHWKGRRLSPASIRDPSDPSHIQCYCPATGQFLDSIPAATRHEMDTVIDKAHVAQLKWEKTTFSERRKVLNTIGKFINDHQEDIARVACRDSGKTMLDASLGEILVTLEKINWTVKHGEKALTPSKRPGPSNILLSYKSAEVRYEPLGVVSSMVSWNYPFHNLMGPVISALFSGNAIVVKCSESVVWSSQYFIKIAKQALKVNGHDPDLVEIICCWPEDADYLTSHPGINHITFIGSRPVAEKVLVAAAEPMTPVVVELGGKDPFIVLDDASNIDNISSYILRGTFQSSGQNCIGIERVIALPKSYDKLVTILSKRITQFRLGSSIDQQENIDMGATITDLRFRALEDLIELAVQQGAKLVYGGKQFIHPRYPQGHYFLPTMLIDVTPDMDIAQQEVFGPVLLMFKAESAKHAIEIANSTQYGLGASVFGKASSKETEMVVQGVKSGNVSVNDFAFYYLCQLPFGGTKGSGYGKFGGAEGLQGLCLAKSICRDKFPLLINSVIPRPVDYPIPDVKRAWKVSTAINVVGYGWGVWSRLRALYELSRNAK